MDMQNTVGAFVKTMKEYPPMQAGGSFNLDAVLEKPRPDMMRMRLQVDDSAHAEDERRVGRGSAVLEYLHVAGQMEPGCDLPVVVHLHAPVVPCSKTSRYGGSNVLDVGADAAVPSGDSHPVARA